jgi:hypothetical protein
VGFLLWEFSRHPSDACKFEAAPRSWKIRGHLSLMADNLLTNNVTINFLRITLVQNCCNTVCVGDVNSQNILQKNPIKTVVMGFWTMNLNL